MPNWSNILPIMMSLLLPGVYLVINQSNSKGRAFMVTFLPDFNRTARHSILVTADAETTVFIYNALTDNHTRHLVAQSSSLHVTFPGEVSILTNLTNEKKGIIVHSTHPVSVYAISSHYSSKAAYLVLPIEKWGDRYIIATYGTANQKGGEFVILAAEDDTILNVELNFVGPTKCKSTKVSYDVTLTLTFTLQRWELCLLACTNDLTGSIIKGTHPFGIISGSQCTKIPGNDAKYCDQIAEMMLPSSMLGTDYIVSPVANRQSKLRIVYNYHDSEIKSEQFIPFQVNFTVSSGLNINYILKNRLFQEIYLDPNTTVHVKTNRSVLVILYSSMIGDAAMTVIPPVDRFDSEYNLFFNWQKLQESEKELVTDVDVCAPSGQISYGLGGTDNCSSNPCQNNGACYTIGHDLRCFCGDQLDGQFCQTVMTTTTEAITTEAITTGAITTEAITTSTTTVKSTSSPTTSTTVKTSTKSSLSTTKSTRSTLSTTKSTKPQESKICNCTCDNVTLETITKTKKEIEKELIVDPKTVHKTKTKYESTYDKRPSAAGIGIMGILFLSLLFGGLALLDMLSAGHFILTMFLHWRERKKFGKHTGKTARANNVERINVSHVIKTNKPPALNTCTRRKKPESIKKVVLPRFKIDESGSVVVDVENSDFDYTNFSSSSQNEIFNMVFDAVIDDKNKFVDEESHEMYNAIDERKVDNSLNRLSLSYFVDKENNSFLDNLPEKDRELTKNVNDFNKIENSFHSVDNSVSDFKIINEQLGEIRTEDDCVSIEMNDLFLNIPPEELVTTDKIMQPQH
ncbi:hypothetical protein Btru_059033 [Bulinus truncatus]|nr:hypothetical protein Btru_059033 [Bulinus truncatus]